MLGEGERQMINSVYAFLSEHIYPIQEPGQRLPIVVLVYLLFEWKKIVAIWIDKEDPQYHQPTPEQLRRLLLAERRRRLLSDILLSLLSGALLVTL